MENGYVDQPFNGFQVEFSLSRVQPDYFDVLKVRKMSPKVRDVRENGEDKPGNLDRSDEIRERLDIEGVWSYRKRLFISSPRCGSSNLEADLTIQEGTGDGEASSIDEAQRSEG